MVICRGILILFQKIVTFWNNLLTSTEKNYIICGINFAITFNKSCDQGVTGEQLPGNTDPRAGLHPRTKKIITRQKRQPDFLDLTDDSGGCDNRKATIKKRRKNVSCGTEKN